jgi:hypothetical protein
VPINLIISNLARIKYMSVLSRLLLL